MLVGIAFCRHPLSGRTKQLPAEELRVRLRESESCGEDSSLVPPTRVRGVQAVVAELHDLHDGVLGAGQLHLERA